jgi:hypothetical protein
MKDTLFDILILKPSFLIIRQECQPILNQQLCTPRYHFNHTYLPYVIHVSLN